MFFIAKMVELKKGHNLVNISRSSLKKYSGHLNIVISASLCPTDDPPQNSEAHCYTNMHAKLVLYGQCADYRCNSEDLDHPAHVLYIITSFFPILRTGRIQT